MASKKTSYLSTAKAFKAALGRPQYFSLVSEGLDSGAANFGDMFHRLGRALHTVYELIQLDPRYDHFVRAGHWHRVAGHNAAVDTS